ncbi:MAG: hypothetical protein GF408_01240 [Candidatus Omnitrophica bacterium]|nr:hypothetical protein [Candidatus Omnitrophota bacterium]
MKFRMIAELVCGISTDSGSYTDMSWRLCGMDDYAVSLEFRNHSSG